MNRTCRIACGNRTRVPGLRARFPRRLEERDMVRNRSQLCAAGRPRLRRGAGNEVSAGAARRSRTASPHDKCGALLEDHEQQGAAGESRTRVPEVRARCRGCWTTAASSRRWESNPPKPAWKASAAPRGACISAGDRNRTDQPREGVPGSRQAAPARKIPVNSVVRRSVALAHLIVRAARLLHRSPVRPLDLGNLAR